jgi:hypothetical protein
MAEMSSRPHWVVYGTPWKDGKVAVVASRDLSSGELRTHLELDEPPRCTLRAEMYGMVVCVGDTYEQAFQGLFSKWRPEACEHPELPGTRAVEP